jgi:hypothetical protein
MITLSGFGRLMQVKAEVFEELLPAEERVRRALDGSGDGPPLDRAGTFAVRQFDRRGHERMRNSSASAALANEDARDEPDGGPLRVDLPSCDLDQCSGRTLVPRPPATGAPADRFTGPSRQDAHRDCAGGRQSFEPPPVSAGDPAGGELGARCAERHAPACRVVRSAANNCARSVMSSGPTGRASTSTPTRGRYLDQP